MEPENSTSPGRRIAGKVGNLPVLATLALWQMRQVWRLFGLIALGMLAAIVLVGTVPLFAQVNTTASVRANFTNAAYDTSSTVQMPVVEPGSFIINKTVAQLKQDYQQIGSPFFDLPPTTSFHLKILESGFNLEVHGYDFGRIASHIHVLQGRLPQAGRDGVEVVLTEDNANALGLHVGSTYTIYAYGFNIGTNPPTATALPVTLKVVGILRKLSATAVDDPFWHGDQLNYQQPSGPPFVPPTVTVIASNSALLAMFDQLARVDPRIKVHFNTQFYAYFPLDVDAITSENVSQLPPLVDYFTNQEPGKFDDSVFFGNVGIDNTAISTILGNIGDQRVVVQVPVLTLLCLMLGLILFFIALVTELLVTRQAEMVALTRSRGATLAQVFLPYVAQSLLLGLLTLLIAPLLIPLVVRALVMALFPPASQSALNVLPITPWGILGDLGWYVWITIAMVLLTMCAGVWRALHSSTLGRSTLQSVGVQRPLWQRLYADALLALLGVLTYGFYTYLTSLGIIDAQAQILLAGPCMLVAATLLCLAGALLFLRAFPWLVRQGARFAARGRGIVPLFSLVVMARAPRQSMRTALLLIFTIAFALFAQVFLATQQQRTTDLATYIAAADVNGQLSQYRTLPGATFEQQEERLQKIPGTLSAALALVADETFLNANSLTTLTVIATDPASFGSSITWPQVDTLSPIEPALSHLADQRSTLMTARIGASLPPVPAIVSTATKNLLHLSVGKTFQSGFNFSTSMSLVDIGEVPYLPGVPNVSQDSGILVDYDSYTAAYKAVISEGSVLSPTTAWLHIRQDAASLVSVRRTLTSSIFPFEALTFRHDVLNELQHDPLYLNLICTLALGIGLTLLLAWIGCLTSAWMYVRNRLRSLLVLRALGTTPAQLGLLLSWEQALIFVTAIALGVACGAGFTALALPNVIFSGTSQLSVIATAFVNNIFQVQSTSLLIVIPRTVWLGLGMVILLCAAGIGITAVTVARLSPAQMLRLSEDYVEEAPLLPERQRVQTQKEDQDALAGGRRGLWRETQLGRALTPVRRSWGTLGLTQLGVLVSALFVCAVPLYSQVAATAGLRDVLTLPANRYVTATTSSLDVIPPGHVQAALAQSTNVLNQAMFGQATPYFHEPPLVTLIDVNAPVRAGSAKQSARIPLTFASLSEQSLASQVKMVQGHISRAGKGSNTLQIMLTPQSAAYLHMQIGDILTHAEGYPFDMQLVGLFQPGRGTGALLPINFFYYSNPSNRSSGVVTALASTEGLVQAIDASDHTQSPAHGSSVVFTGNVTWNYPLDETVTSSQLDDLLATLSTLHVEAGRAQSDTFALSTLYTPLAALEQYQQSVVVSSVPIISISVLIIALILLFLGFMVDLLVEREAGAIAILRSRGATHRQIFAAFLKRTLLINGIGLLVGMILAIPVVILLTRLTLQPVDQAGLNLLANQPAQVFFSLVVFALASTVVTLLAMGLALAQATRADYLSLRREATRARHKPFWQRWYLDVVGMAIALTAYGYSVYLTNAGILSAAIDVQVKTPLVLTTTIFLVLTCSLFLLRLYPLLLRLGTKVAMRNRGVEPMLALSQMARTPRQRLRTALLLMFTTAFVVFAVIFAASQNQHIDDVARYWAGADFSGTLPTALTSEQAAQEQKAYSAVSGVTSVTLGHVETLETDSSSQEVTMLAVDPRSFMRTVNWPASSASQQQTLAARLSNPDLFPDLAGAWTNATGDSIPAVVDAQTALELHVTPGQSFTLGTETFFEVAEVKAIPTVNDLSLAGGSTGSSAGASAGILVNYQMYNRVYQNQFFAVTDIPIDSIWLKTNGSTQSLLRVRNILESGPLQLASFYDRQVSAQALNRDPLNLNLAGILFLGALAPLLLTWIGCLMASWVDMRQRQLLFGVLRALGSTSRQLAKVLSWEQALVFGTSVMLGTLFGLLMAFLALPSLVLTSVLPTLSIAGGGSVASSAQDLFSLQSAPGVHTVIPLSLAGVVLALVALAALAVILITRSASRIALGQALRLNED